jgi:hypothetical protein
LMCIYIDRYLVNNKIKDFLNDNNSHAIIAISFLFASIMLDDNWGGNAQKPFYALYAKISCIPIAQIKKYQIQFLEHIDFNLYVSDAQFKAFKDYLEKKDMIKPTPVLQTSIMLFSPPSSPNTLTRSWITTAEGQKRLRI